VILDVDTGTDDAVAIMFAALHPELELVAVTTVNGNVPVGAAASACGGLRAPHAGAARRNPPGARFVGRRIDAYSSGHRVAVADAAPVHDALCTAFLVERDVIETRPLHVRVETQGALTVGRTVMDTRTHASAPANCDVAFGAGAARFVQLLLSAFEISAFGRTTSASP
jgi:purine nucleosidase/ribosylpyrimidine nucleosidase